MMRCLYRYTQKTLVTHTFINFAETRYIKGRRDVGGSATTHVLNGSPSKKKKI